MSPPATSAAPVATEQPPAPVAMPTEPVSSEPVASTPEPAAEPAGTAAPAADELPADSCEGIKKDMPCATPGTCSALVCGLADLGTRSCVCDTNWTCTSCEFPTGADAPEVLLEPPADMPLAACDTATVVEEEPCTTMGERCALDDGDICACWLTDSDGATIWDCDSPPW